MATPVTKVLLVEDNPADARLLREALAEIADSRFEISHCETLAKPVSRLRRTRLM